jgi:hypothetical protein
MLAGPFCSQELNATHVADMRLLQEAKERERALWEREIDAALTHVKVGAHLSKVFSSMCTSDTACVRLRDAHARRVHALTPTFRRLRKRSSAMKQRVLKKS